MLVIEQTNELEQGCCFEERQHFLVWSSIEKSYGSTIFNGVSFMVK